LYPGLVQFHGYNWAMDGCVPDVVNWALNGYAAFLMLVRGQQGRSVDNIVPAAVMLGMDVERYFVTGGILL